MKQHITQKEFNTLPLKQQVKLNLWCKEKGYYAPHLSIGQMMEFLEEYNPSWDIHVPQKGELNKGDLKHKDDDKYWEERDMSNPYDWQVETNSVGSYNTRELRDALWEAVKEFLCKD